MENMGFMTGKDIEKAVMEYRLYDGFNQDKDFLGLTIHSQTKFEKYLKGVKNPWPSFRVTELVRNGDWFRTYTTTYPAGLVGKYVKEHLEKSKVFIAPNVRAHVENFFYGFLNVTVKDGGLKDLLKSHGHIYRVMFGSTEYFVILRKNKDGLYIQELTGKKCTLNPQMFLDINSKDFKVWARDLKMTVIDYTPVGGWSSAGQLKKNCYVWVARNLAGFHPWAVFNRLTHGMARLQRKWEQPGVGEDMAKLSVRQSQGAAPMLDLEPMTGMAIVLGKLNNGSVEHDGFSFIRSEYVAHAYSTNRVKVMPWAVEGFGSQDRPCLMTKTFGLVVPGKFIANELWYSGKYRIHFIPADQWKHYQKDWEEAVLSKGKSGKFALTEADKAAGREYSVLVIVPTLNDGKGGYLSPRDLVSHVDYMTDLNGLKAPFDLRYGLSGLNPLCFGHAHDDLEDRMKLSTQLIQKLDCKDFEGTEALVAQLADRAFTKKLEKLLKVESRRLSANELGGDPNAILEAISPKFVKERWGPAFKRKLLKTFEGLKNRIKRLQFPVDGLYNKISPDLGGFFGIDLLEIHEDYVEIYSPGLEKQGIKEVAGLRYPSIGQDEYLICKVVSRHELLERAQLAYADGKISFIEFFFLCRMIITLHGGVTAIPENEYILAGIGGADFDGDGMIFVHNEDALKILKRNFRVTAINICR